MIVATYSRVSTNQQSCSLQLEALREYCKTRGFQIYREYTDTGVSGAKVSRPRLNALMADAKLRKFDAVIVYKLDRFARSIRQLIFGLDELRKSDVAFISTTEGLDFSTPSGRMIFGILGVIAEFERELIRERVKGGVARCQEQLKTQGFFVRKPKKELGESVGQRVSRWGRRPIPVDVSQIPLGTSVRAAAALLGRNREVVRKALAARKTAVQSCTGPDTPPPEPCE